MSAVNDIIRLGQKLAEAQEKIDRLASVDQAVGESEARLAALVAREAAQAKIIAEQREAANQLTEGAKVQAEAIRTAAYADASRIRSEAAEEAEHRTGESQRLLLEIGSAFAEKQAELRALEGEETRLAQSVTVLKAELEQLRSRILG